MPKQRIFIQYDVPLSVVLVVNAICGDYKRRALEIERNRLSVAILENYTRLNSVVDKALSDIEEGFRREMLRDICEGRGYGKSGIQVILSKNAYYRRRRKLVHDIAKDLSLIE